MESRAGALSASTEKRNTLAVPRKYTPYEKGYQYGVNGGRIEEVPLRSMSRLDATAFHHGVTIGRQEREKKNAQTATS